MRCGPFLAVLVLLLGVGSAAAQSPGIIPTPEPEAKPAKKHLKPKAVAAKPAETKPAGKKVAAKPAAPKAATPKPVAPKVTATPAKFEPASDALAGVPFGERAKIQAALLWSGDYSGATGDDPILAAIKNYQKRNKAKITGTLTPSERAGLLTDAKRYDDEFGWRVVVDPATGIRIGLPAKLVPHAHDATRGTRWSSAHGEVQVETFRIKDPALTLGALFEKEKKQPATRRVESSALHDSDFLITGMQGLKMFSVRAKARDGEVRGYTMLYDQMMEGIVAPVTGAMASAFSPFPERSAPYAALVKSVEYGTGLVVSPQGHIITDRKITEGCQVLVAAGLGDADRVAVDKDSGLALLRVYGQHKLSALALTTDPPKSSELTLVGIADPKEQSGSRKLTEVKARLTDSTAIELHQPMPMAGFSGAAALDPQGRFLGMMEMGNIVLASVDATVPPVRLVKAETIRDFLAAHHVQTVTTPPTDAKAGVVRVICVRK